MSSPDVPQSVEKKEPTVLDGKMFIAIVRHMKGTPEVDWAAVAVEMNLANPGTAKVRFGQIKKKLGLGAPAAENDTPGSGKKTPAKRTPKTPKTPKSGVKSAKKDGEDPAAGGSPVPKKRKYTPRQNKKVATPDPGGKEEDVHETEEKDDVQSDSGLTVDGGSDADTSAE